MNCSALSLDEDDATATTWWATSEASRTLGSIRRSFVNTVGNKLFHGFLSYPSIVEVELLLSAIQPVATNQLALFLVFMETESHTHNTPSNDVWRHDGSKC